METKNQTEDHIDIREEDVNIEAIKEYIRKAAEIINEELKITTKKYNVVDKPQYLERLNICCSEKELDFLSKKVPLFIKEYPYVSISDIAFTVTYIYYSLVLGEQSEDHLARTTKNKFDVRLFPKLKDSKYKTELNNWVIVKKIFMDITTGESELSTNIRRSFLFDEDNFFIDKCGGNKKRKYSRKYSKNHSRKYSKKYSKKYSRKYSRKYSKKYSRK